MKHASTLIVFLAVLGESTAARADIVLVLAEKERDALVLSLGVAMQAQPLLAPNIVALFNKIVAAPPEVPKEPAKKDDAP